jgi:hypothetical protein
MRQIKRSLLLLAAVTATALLGACGNPNEMKLPETGATLEGTVKYGKDDVQFAMILIQTSSGSATANVKDGKYKAENVPLGEVMIGVNTNAAKGDYQSAIMGSVNKGPDAKGKGKTEVKFIDVPAKFGEPTSSGIKTTVVKGLNTYNIEIGK